MSVYAYEVIRWPFDVQNPNHAFSFQEDGVGPPTSVQNITTGIYINDGSASVIAPKDFVKAFKDIVNLAITALGLGGSCTAVLTPAGHISLTWTAGGGGDLLLFGLTATQQMWLGTAALTQVIFNNQTTAFKWQAGNQWHPGVDADNDSGKVKKILASEGKNLLGRPRRVVRSAAPWYQRRLMWSFIASARMLTERAALAGFSDAADLIQGEDNTWENMWDYLMGAPGPYGDNRVYLYLMNTPSTAVNQGPYEVILSESTPGIDGVSPGGYVGGMAVEHFMVALVLRSV